MPRPIGRAIGRAAIRGAVGPARVARRVGRRIVRRTTRRVYRRRVVVGTAIVFVAAEGSASPSTVKMSSADVQRVESSTGKPVEELTEEELKDAMKRLGIQKLELTPEEQRQVAGPAPAGGEFECSECHGAVTATQKFCPSCGAELQ